MNPSETQNVFFTLKTSPEMIKYKSAKVTVRSVFVPNRSIMNYKLVRFKTLNFKTRFQNNGKGPARTIRLETDIPDIFDKKTFKIEDICPKCPICPKDEVPTTSCLDTIILKKQIHFTFKNIYLLGSTQKNVKEIDSTN